MDIWAAWEKNWYYIWNQHCAPLREQYICPWQRETCSWELFNWTLKLLGYEIQKNRIREAGDGSYLQSSLHFPANEGYGFTHSALKKNVSDRTDIMGLCKAGKMLILHPVLYLCLKEGLQTTKAFIWIFTPVDDCLQLVFSNTVYVCI